MINLTDKSTDELQEMLTILIRKYEKGAELQLAIIAESKKVRSAIDSIRQVIDARIVPLNVENNA